MNHKAPPPRSVPPPPPPLPPCQQPSTSTPTISVQCRPHPLQPSIEVAARDCVMAIISFDGKHRPALQDLRGMGLTRAMRALDALRRHNATQEEVDVLGISGRLDVQERAQLLMLCGCQRGGRLTSDEMQTVHRVTRDMVEAYTCLELLFQALARQKTKQPVGNETENGCKLEAFFEAAETWLGLYETARRLARDKRAQLVAISSAQPRPDLGTPQSEEPCSSRPFPDWLATLMERYRIDEHLETCTARGTPLLPPAPDDDAPAVVVKTSADAEGVVNRSVSSPPAPAWRAAAAATADACCAVDSLARFSRFLALLVLTSSDDQQSPSMTEREREALAELLLASDDGSDRGSNASASSSSSRSSRSPYTDDRRGEEKQKEETELSTTSPSCPAPTRPPPPPPPPPPPTAAAATTVRPLRYWALRLHRFLLSVRELKAVPERGMDALERTLSDTSLTGSRSRRGGGSRRGGASLSPTRQERRTTTLSLPPPATRDCLAGGNGRDCRNSTDGEGRGEGCTGDPRAALDGDSADGSAEATASLKEGH